METLVHGLPPTRDVLPIARAADGIVVKPPVKTALAEQVAADTVEDGTKENAAHAT